MTLDRLRVVLRADGSGDLGFGHLMRVLAVGGELRRRGHDTLLLATRLPDAFAPLAADNGIETIMQTEQPGSVGDAKSVVAQGPQFVLADGYYFDAAFYEHLAMAGVAHGVFDDQYVAPPPTASIVVNGNPAARVSDYELPRDTRLLLGCDYLVIRDDVRGLRRGGRTFKAPHTSLLAIGGTDVLGLSAELQALLTRDGSINVVGPHIASSQWTPGDVARALATCDVAVIGGGVTMWEAAYLGTPSVSLIVAENQVPGVAAASELGVTRAIECHNVQDLPLVRDCVRQLLADLPALVSMSQRGRTLVDGRGIERIADAIEREAGTRAN